MALRVFSDIMGFRTKCEQIIRMQLNQLKYGVKAENDVKDDEKTNLQT